MAKQYKWAFADNSANRASVPDESLIDGRVSYQDGYGYDYSRKRGSSSLAKDVERTKLNQILNDATGNLLHWQQNAYPEWYADTAYRAGARVSYSDVSYIALVAIADTETAPDVNPNWANINTMSELGLTLLNLASVASASFLQLNSDDTTTTLDVPGMLSALGITASTLGMLRANADNTLSLLSYADLRTALGLVNSSEGFLRANADNSVSVLALNSFLQALGLRDASAGTAAGTLLGSNCSATGSAAATLGGTSNIASGDDSTASGRFASTHGLLAARAHASYPFSTVAGSRQQIQLELMQKTTSATPAFLTCRGGAGNATDHYILQDNSAAYVVANVIASDSSGNTASWEVKATVKRGTGVATAAMVGSATITQIHADAGAAGWGLAAFEDTTYGGFKIRVDGAAATNIWWGASLTATELTRL